MNTAPPDRCPAWAKLEARAAIARGTSLAERFAADPTRAGQAVEAPGLRLDYSRQHVDAQTLALLVQLAEERGLGAWRCALLAGEPVNSTENRPAWHTALRAAEQAPAEVRAALGRMEDLARDASRFERIVSLGAGGSDLGPRLVVDALCGVAQGRVRFVATSDPLALARALEGADPARTLVIAVSKSFTTPETLANARAAKEWLGGRAHLYAVTADARAAREFGASEVLPMWDWVGGRFSVWSAAGFAALCAIGAERFRDFLAGARDLDRHFAATPPERNLPVLMALIGVWNVNFLGAATHAVLPYAHALRLLPAYLQQLEMESNGKSIDREGREIGYATAPVVWGVEGPPSQHSFHQLLHQGTQVVPVDFVVAGVSADADANAEAQADALARGTTDPGLPAHRRHPGNRPSSLLRLERLDARNLGRLIAAWEHKVFAQGVLWNVNSFDQWGVELGKQLARAILERRR
jgi:glucose-6-phosphate isomerase